MSNTNKYNFQKLTPINDMNIEIYKEALDFVFNNDDLLNIAISGAYCSGKSSMLETYKKENKEQRFLHISLAHFGSAQIQDNDQQETDNENENLLNDPIPIKESVLEGKILNQLIHQIDPNLIPQTNFRIKQRISSFQIVTDALLSILFLLFLFHILWFDQWHSLVNSLFDGFLKSLLQIFIKPESIVFSGFLTVVLLAICLYRLIKLQANKCLFKRFSVQGNEIEIFEESTDSYFDKYLNEVLYLFDNAHADVIVFEDLDRFDTNQIFERLREINSLINKKRKKRIETFSSRLIEWDETNQNITPLRFFYLLRDDIFVSKERTKFFDFIIPIVPVIDGSNSYDQFIAHLKQGNLFGKFNKDFLQELSVYIDDMRILKNIYNEFSVYHNRLNKIELDYNKMMALIVYKNFFPRDFSELQLQKGFVYTIFSKKSEFIKKEIESVDNRLQEIERQIDDIHKEPLETPKELQNEKNRELAKINPSPNDNQKILKLQEIENIYSKRELAIQNKKENRLPDLENEFARLKIELIRTKHMPLHDIINKNNKQQIFAVTSTNEIEKKRYFKEVKGSNYFDLLKLLIRRGYIDETYPDYLSYFYEYSLSAHDKIFLRRVMDQNENGYSYILEDPAKVVSKLPIHYFKEQEILNYDLLFYLLKTPERQEYTNTLFKQLEQTKNYSFIQEAFLLKQDYDLDLLVNQLNSSWTSFLSEILINKDFNESCRYDFILRTLYQTTDEDIELINIDECLTEHISQSPSFLNLEKPNIDRLIDRFKLLQVKFISLDYEVSDKALFHEVYMNDLYELNFTNILLMLSKEYGLDQTNDFIHRNLTLITTVQNSPLSIYIWKYIDEYLSIILDKCENSILDDEAVAIQVLNSANVSIENKKSYIDKLHTIIRELKKVDDTNLWKQLLEEEKIHHTESNIIDYFLNCKKVLTPELKCFIDVPDVTYDFSKIYQGYKEDDLCDFYIEIIKFNELSNKHYREILTSLDRYFEDEFSYEGINDDKFDILIEIGAIQMHSNILPFIREKYPNHVLYYIEKNIKEYTELVKDNKIFIFKEMEKVLSLEVDDSYKITLLGYTQAPISVIDTKYSDRIKEHILINNFLFSDIEQLLCGYSHESENIKRVVENLTIEHKGTLIANKYTIPYELIDRLTSSGEINLDDKQQFFLLALDGLNQSQCRNILKKLGYDGYEGLFQQKRPKFEINEFHNTVLTYFKKNGWISKFVKDKDDPACYRAYGRKEKILKIF